MILNNFVRFHRINLQKLPKILHQQIFESYLPVFFQLILNILQNQIQPSKKLFLIFAYEISFQKILQTLLVKLKLMHKINGKYFKVIHSWHLNHFLQIIFLENIEKIWILFINCYKIRLYHFLNHIYQKYIFL